MKQKRIKKILMVAATPFFADRGCHIRIYSEYKYLVKEGLGVKICTYSLGETPIGMNIQDIKRSLKLPFHKKLSPGPSVAKIIADIFLLYTSIKEYIRFRPNLIHAHQYESLAIAVIIKFLTLGRAKVLFDTQGSLSEELYAYTLQKYKFGGLVYKIFFLFEGLLLKFPDYIVCSSINSYEFLRDRFKIDKSRMSILPDGIDLDLFVNQIGVPKGDLKESLGIPKGNTVLVYTGSIARAKGIDDLLEIFPEISKKNPNLTLLLVGYGDLVKYYSEKYSKYVKSRLLIFGGRTSYFSLPSYLSISDYAIDTKNNSSESSGKLLNYIAIELPVICFDNKFNRQLLGNKGIYINVIADLLNLNFTKRTKPIQYDTELTSSVNYKNIIKNYINDINIRYL